MTRRYLHAPAGVEVELLVGALAEAVGVPVEALPDVRWTWLDAADGTLLEAGVGLVLEATGEGLRLHDRAQRGAPGPRVRVAREPEGPAHLPRGALRSRLATALGGRPLAPALVTTARSWVVGPARVVALEAVAAPGAPSPLAVEVVVDRPGDAGPALRRVLRRFGVQDGAVSAKAVMRAAGRARDKGGRGIPLDPLAPSGAAVRHVLRPLVDTLRDEIASVAAGATDPEPLHQARVALRAIRALLGLLGHRLGLGRRRLRRLRERLADLQGATGPARDLDVQAQALAADPEAPVALTASVQAGRARAAAELQAWLAEGGARRTLRRLDKAIAPGSGTDEDPAAAEPVALAVRSAVHAAWTRVLTEGRAIGPTSPAEALHDLRKSCKKLRYLLETFQRILPAEAVSAAVRDLKGLQAVLGDFQDAHVTLEHARAARDAGVDPDAVHAFLAVVSLRADRVREGFDAAFRRFDTPAGAARSREIVGMGAAPSGGNKPFRGRSGRSG